MSIFDWLWKGPPEYPTYVPPSFICHSTGLMGIYDKETIEKARELMTGLPPEAPITPYINVIISARTLGLEVSRAAARGEGTVGNVKLHNEVTK